MVAGEQFYKIFYGIGSHSIHGNWQDILVHNLEDEGAGKYKLNLEWNTPRPQLMDGAIAFNLNLTKIFVEIEKVADKEEYLKTVTTLSEYQNDLQNTHEIYLTKKRMPTAYKNNA